MNNRERALILAFIVIFVMTCWAVITLISEVPEVAIYDQLKLSKLGPPELERVEITSTEVNANVITYTGILHLKDKPVRLFRAEKITVTSWNWQIDDARQRDILGVLER